jgi:hypothetical protein
LLLLSSSSSAPSIHFGWFLISCLFTHHLIKNEDKTDCISSYCKSVLSVWRKDWQGGVKNKGRKREDVRRINGGREGERARLLVRGVSFYFFSFLELSWCVFEYRQGQAIVGVGVEGTKPVYCNRLRKYFYSWFSGKFAAYLHTKLCSLVWSGIRPDLIDMWYYRDWRWWLVEKM